MTSSPGWASPWHSPGSPNCSSGTRPSPTPSPRSPARLTRCSATSPGSSSRRSSRTPRSSRRAGSNSGARRAGGPRYQRVLDRRDRLLPVVRLGPDGRILAGRRGPAEHAAESRPGAARGVRIQRAVILPDALWPGGLRRRRAGPPLARRAAAARDRTPPRQGSSLSGEPDLPSDFGLYGDLATGTHELDDAGRTRSYALDFDPGAFVIAADRWTRLLLHATPYAPPGPGGPPEP